MSFLTDLSSITPQIATANTNAISEFFARSDHRFALDLTLRDLVLERVNLGKLMRGSIIIALGRALGVSNDQALLTAASAVEIFGYGILVQDDVTDKSVLRRGKPTIQQALLSTFDAGAYADTNFLADQTAFYLGDVLYFLSSEMLQSLVSLDPDYSKVAEISFRELQLLGLGQIEDLRLASLNIRSGSNDKPTTGESDILAMIAAKSGRYSVRWPVEVAGALAGLNDALIAQIGDIGQHIGVLFQLRDDELGLFGDEKIIGKSTTSDITEGKKTLFWSALNNRLPATDPVWEAFGNPDATPEAITRFKQTVLDSGVAKEVRDLMESMKYSTNQEIDRLNIPTKARELLLELSTFVVERKK